MTGSPREFGAGGRRLRAHQAIRRRRRRGSGLHGSAGWIVLRPDRAYLGRMRGLPIAGVRSRAGELMDSLELPTATDQVIGDYSTGMRPSRLYPPTAYRILVENVRTEVRPAGLPGPPAAPTCRSSRAQSNVPDLARRVLHVAGRTVEDVLAAPAGGDDRSMTADAAIMHGSRVLRTPFRAWLVRLGWRGTGHHCSTFGPSGRRCSADAVVPNDAPVWLRTISDAIVWPQPSSALRTRSAYSSSTL